MTARISLIPGKTRDHRPRLQSINFVDKDINNVELHSACY